MDDGQMKIETCTDKALQYDEYHDIEAEIGTTMEKWMVKKSS